MQRFLSAKRDKRWLIGIAPMTAVLILVFAGLTRAALGRTPVRTDYVIFLVMSLVASIALCGFGYAALPIAFGCCAAGLAAGMAYMAYVFTRPIQWAGIVGLVSGAQLAIIFFLAGVCLQMLNYLSKRRIENGRKK